MQVKEILREITDFFGVYPEFYYFDEDKGKLTYSNHYAYSAKVPCIGVDPDDEYFCFLKKKREEICDEFPYAEYLREKMDSQIALGSGMLVHILRGVGNKILNDIKNGKFKV